MSKSNFPLALSNSISFAKKGYISGKLLDKEGPSFELPYSIPSEKLRVSLIGKGKKRFGEIKEIEVASPDRVTAPCPYFGSCGGCQFQHIEQKAQKKLKEAFVYSLFSSLLENLEGFLPLIESPEAYHYRNKMEFSFSQNKEKDPFLGLYPKGKKGVMNLDGCLLTSSFFSSCLKNGRLFWEKTTLEAFHPIRNTGSLRTLTVRESVHTGDRLVMITVSGDPKYAWSKEQIELFKEIFLEEETKNPLKGDLSLFIRIQQAIPKEPTRFFEMLLHGKGFIEEKLEFTLYNTPLSLTFHVEPSSFFQPNTKAAPLLFAKALEMAELKKDDVVFDLYCGGGALGIAASFFVKKVYAVEKSAESIVALKENIKLNKRENITLFKGDVGDILEDLEAQKEIKASVAIIDPPREGLLPKAMETLLRLKPERIVYISCNPLTQQKNVEELVKNGYTLKTVQPVDQFPHTYHVENIAYLYYNP